MPTISVSLFFKEGSSDKQYDVLIEERADGYAVDAFYGRRGGPFKAAPQGSGLTLDEAQALFTKIVNGKTRKGYKPDTATDTAVLTSVTSRDDTGLRPQLLNPISPSQAQAYIDDPDVICQEKFDGQRLLISIASGNITAANRKGQRTIISSKLEAALRQLPVGVVLDGEIVEGVYYIFDLLEIQTQDLRPQPYIDRLAELHNLTTVVPFNHPILFIVRSYHSADEKANAIQAIRKAGGEGVVFKQRNAPFSAGRPASGGAQVKLKFWASASCIVTAINQQRSVALEMIDNGQRVHVGNVTVKANQEIPAPNTICEVKYLYIAAKGGSLVQPELIAVRTDLDIDDCNVDQLQIKNAENSSAATIV